MRRLFKRITNKLSVRLSVKVVMSVAVLLFGAMIIMLHFSRKAIKQEALEKAQITLDGSVEQIDNILLTVEQSTGNFYWNLLRDLDYPEKMDAYCLRQLEATPYITGATIALEPYFYGRQQEQFFVYYRRQSQQGHFTKQSPLLKTETFGTGPYRGQEWYATPIKEGRTAWIGPLKDTDAEGEAVMTFALPIFDRKGQRVGVLAVDMALSLLTDIIHATKPSPNSYCTLLGRDGSIIVQPDTTKHQKANAIVQESDQATIDAAKAMMAGETGYKQLTRKSKNYYIFYKPFERADVPGRANDQLGWSVGIIYPESDIMGEYNRLLYVVLAIGIIGVIVLLLLCQTILHRQLLPLRLLTRSAQRIAKGHFDETIPESKKSDEIGQLQNHFIQMQQSLDAQMGELKHLTYTLQQRGENLNAAYSRAQEANRIKTAFLHNMTNQMLAPSGTIVEHVSRLNDTTHDLTPEEADRLAEEIQQQGEAITELLNNLIITSQTKA